MNWRENFSAALPLGQDSAHINTKGEQLAASNKKNWENFKQHELTFCLGFWPSTNPRFYKYSWQIWTPECGLEGQDFFVRGNRMSTASFVELVEKMEAEKQPGWIYSSKRPRLGIDTPFDKNHHKWREVEFAISWDDDPEPIWNGHK